MRIAFWITAAMGLILAAAYFIFPSPLSSEVSRLEIDDLYGSLLIWCSVLGAVAGAVSIGLAYRYIQHEPKEHARNFLGRVGAWGFWTLIVAALLALLLSLTLVAMRMLGPLAPGEKLAIILPTGKYLSVLGASVACAALAFLTGARARSWGGQYALTHSPKI